MKAERAVFVGDFCLGADVVDSDCTSETFNPWLSIHDQFGRRSNILANLECPVTDLAQGRPFKYANLKMSPRFHGCLDGIAMAVLGNNHAGDYGVEGIRETQSLLSAKGIEAVGHGETIKEALEPAFLDLDGGRLGVVSLCCPTTNSEYLATHLTPGTAPLGMATLGEAVRTARPMCDALVAYLHWGCEHVHDPAPDQLRLARHAIDAGADAVIGCHSHAIQGYEQYRGRWIFYGLGNYLFNHGPLQSVNSDGTVDWTPQQLTPANRESLAVSMRIVPDDGQGRLKLQQIQPMRFDDDLIPKPISINELSFDLQAANDGLRSYVARHQDWLASRREPEYIARLRNGVLAYWYRVESIKAASPPLKSQPIFVKLRRLLGRARRLL